MPRSPETFSPFFFIAAIPTETASGSASSRVIRPSAPEFGLHRRTPSTAESLSRYAGSLVSAGSLPDSMTARSLPVESRNTAASASMSWERR